MAVIQKIRNKYGKLAGGIIAVALVGFIFMDAASGRFGEFFGHNTSVAKVDGNKIDEKDYSLRQKEYETLYGIFAKGRALDDNSRAQLNTEALQNMLFEQVAAEACDKLGIETTDEEKKDLIYGAYPDPMVQQYPIFADPQTGAFDSRRVKAFEQQANQVDPTGKMLSDWENVKSYILRNNRYTKFVSLFVNSIYTPKYLAEELGKGQAEEASIKYVKVPLTFINDNEVKVTDQDINDYIQKHAAQFQVYEPSRSIAYVSFDVIPTHADTARALDPMNNLKNDFVNAKDAENFVNRNSDDQFVKGVYFNKTNYPSHYMDTLLKQPVGTVFGPYLENNSYKLTKILDKKDLPDTVKCRHILIVTKAQGKDILPDSVAKNRIDSIVGAIKAGADFKALAQQYSDDNNSKKNGGEMTIPLQQRSGLVKEFGDFIFEGKTGDNKVIKVNSDNYSGYHYVEILDQKGIQPAIQMATISKSVFAGDSTEQAVYAKATEFAAKSTTPTAFDETVKKMGYNQRLGESVKPGDFTIQGLGPDREIVRWMYAQKVGDVSNVFSSDNRYIVAKLTDVHEKGLLQVTDEIKPRLEALVKAEKKGDMIAAKFKSLGSLDAIAKAANQQVQQADSFNQSAMYIPNLGYQPKVLGYSFYKGLNPNTVSQGIKGTDGVYFISITNRWTRQLDPTVINMMQRQLQMQQMQEKNGMNEMLRQMLLRKADIKLYPNNI